MKEIMDVLNNNLCVCVGGETKRAITQKIVGLKYKIAREVMEEYENSLVDLAPYYSNYEDWLDENK